MPDAIGFTGDLTGELGPAIGVDDDDGVDEDAADDEEEDGGSGEAELVRVGVGGAGLESRSTLREPSRGDLEGKGRFGMMLTGIDGADATRRRRGKPSGRTRRS